VTTHSSLRIPAEQATGILDALVESYARKAEALAEATRAYRGGRTPVEAVSDARHDLIEAESTLDAVGWRLGPRTHEFELAGPRDDVRTALYAALLSAARAVYAACEEYEAARLDRAALTSAVHDLVRLHGLFDAFEANDARGVD
jgi:hypothetical protein